MILTVFSVVMVLIWIGMALYVVINSRKVVFLKSLRPDQGNTLPSVAIIIAVKDEEVEVEEALRSVCGLRYPALRIIVVNDRSMDRTPEILERMAKKIPSIEIITIDDLPMGWLGKNHALYQGFRVSAEDFVISCDLSPW